MFGEFKFLGMYFPHLLLASLLALFATRLVSMLLARNGLYRHIWHPPLFDMAMYLIMLGLCVTLYSFFRS